MSIMERILILKFVNYMKTRIKYTSVNLLKPKAHESRLEVIYLFRVLESFKICPLTCYYTYKETFNQLQANELYL